MKLSEFGRRCRCDPVLAPLYKKLIDLSHDATFLSLSIEEGFARNRNEKLPPDKTQQLDHYRTQYETLRLHLELEATSRGIETPNLDYKELIGPMLSYKRKTKASA